MGETYNQMIEIKFQTLEQKPLTQKKATKINKLYNCRVLELTFVRIMKAIKHFKSFHNLFDEKGQIKVEEGNIEAFLISHLVTARLYPFNMAFFQLFLTHLVGQKLLTLILINK